MNLKLLNPDDYESADSYVFSVLKENDVSVVEADTVSSIARIHFKETKKVDDGQKESHTLEVEIFAVGKWNGIPFSIDDLQNIATSFNKLKQFHRVPLKFGHNNEQQMTDGFPALGWVEDVWVDNGKDGKPKLFGRFSEIPDLVYNAIDKGLYKNVSIELDVDVQHMGRNYKYVLSGVALLGADLPAVNTIADLKTYMSRDLSTLDVTFNRRKTFTLTNEVQDMDLEKLQAELEALKAKTAELEAENRDLNKSNMTFSAEKERLEAEMRIKEVANARNSVTAILDDAVSDMRITPAKKQAFSKLLGIDDDDKVLSIDVDTVKALCDSEAPRGSSQQAFSKTENKYEDDSKTAGEILHEMTEDLMHEKGLDYKTASEQVFRRNPDLANKHLNFGGGA